MLIASCLNALKHKAAKASFTLQAEPSRAEPDWAELNRDERVTIHIASRADPN